MRDYTIVSVQVLNGPTLEKLRPDFEGVYSFWFDICQTAVRFIR